MIVLRWFAVLTPALVGCGFQVQSSGGTSGDARGDAVDAIDGTTAIDATIGNPDAPNCFGTGLVRVCLATVPTAPRVIVADLAIDTGTSSLCEATTNAEAANLCVLSGMGIELASSRTLRARGTRPLVLISTTKIDVSGTLDVSSRPGVPGPNSDPDLTACPPGSAATNGGSGGGGYGGSFGGKGADGESNDGGVGGVAPAPVAPASITALRGGCRGGSSTLSSSTAAGGRGGGAVALIAWGQITIPGVINASGEGGKSGGFQDQGSGGGGSGGMIVLDGATITNTGAIYANGGGGAEGNGVAGGKAGSEPVSATAAAPGGSGNSTFGGDGGAGSLGGAGGAVIGNATTSGGGGGGGGGGTGVIKTSVQLTGGGAVSPAP